MGKYFDDLENTTDKANDLESMDRSAMEKIKGWYRVMFKDNLWIGNFSYSKGGSPSQGAAPFS